jgi:hypothetical protein
VRDPLSKPIRSFIALFGCFDWFRVHVPSRILVAPYCTLDGGAEAFYGARKSPPRLVRILDTALHSREAQTGVHGVLDLPMLASLDHVSLG